MSFTMKQSIPSVLVGAILTALVGCGGSDSGQENTANPPPPADSGDQGIVYSGPTAATEDVLQFKLNVWDNLAADDRCGGCHNEVVGQEPMFMRRDDVNQAYEASLPLMDRIAPVLSRLVSKADEGHNIWSPAAPDIIENYIQGWATATGATQNVIVLEAPPVQEVGVTLRLPADSSAYEQYIYPLVRNTATANCVACHSEDSALRQQPFFASSNVDTAYLSARTLIDLSNPVNSRFVQRMQEGHNVWQDPSAVMTPTAYSVQEMLAAVNNFITNGVPEPEPIDEEFLVSYATIIPDGVIASSGGRVENDVIALYEFKEGAGAKAFDTSGVDPALDLNLSPTVEWVGSWGIRIEDNGKAQGDTASSKKLNDLIKLTGEYSVETWVIPANVTQEESRIVTYSGGTNDRNFSLHQTIYDYEFLARTENSDANGMPLLNTPSAEEILQATLQHVVATYDPAEGRQIWVNGELAAEDATNEFAGNISDWDDSYVLAVGNEVDNANWWEGTVRLLAIHNRVLTGEQVLANFEAGVGQKYFLLFGVSDLVDMDEAFVVFSVEVFDDYSYLFSSPFFISLDREAVPSSDINIEGIRIGINGKESPIGQAFANIDVTINTGNYDANVGVPLATNPLGTLIAVEHGADTDQFFLTFDAIGGDTYDRPDDEVPPGAEDADLETQPELGLRLFDEIYENMSAITSVPSARVSDLYNNEIRRSLPSAESAYGFLSSQQSAVTQLALAYCTELVGDSGLRLAFFPDFNFSGGLSSAAERDAVIDPILANMLVSNGLVTQPDATEMKAELNALIDNMTTNQTSTKVTAVCTAALGSAVMLLQ